MGRLLAELLTSLDAAVDHLGGVFGLVWQCNDSHDDPGRFLWARGVGRPRDDGQPESSGPGFGGRGLTVLRTAQ